MGHGDYVMRNSISSLTPRTTEFQSRQMTFCICYNSMNRICLILELFCIQGIGKRLPRLLLVSEAGVVVSKLVGVFRADIFEVMVVIASFSLLVVKFDEYQDTKA